MRISKVLTGRVDVSSKIPRASVETNFLHEGTEK